MEPFPGTWHPFSLLVDAKCPVPHAGCTALLWTSACSLRVSGWRRRQALVASLASAKVPATWGCYSWKFCLDFFFPPSITCILLFKLQKPAGWSAPLHELKMTVVLEVGFVPSLERGPPGPDGWFDRGWRELLIHELRRRKIWGTLGCCWVSRSSKSWLQLGMLELTISIFQEIGWTSLSQLQGIFFLALESTHKLTQYYKSKSILCYFPKRDSS